MKFEECPAVLRIGIYARCLPASAGLTSPLGFDKLYGECARCFGLSFKDRGFLRLIRQRFQYIGDELFRIPIFGVFGISEPNQHQLF